ncbi:MAG: hypothetical protein ACI3YC_02710 [Alloprevotella sp.]
MKKTMTFACLCLMAWQVYAQETLHGLKTFATGKFRTHATVMESYNGKTHSDFFLVRVPKDSVSPSDLYTIRSAYNSAMSEADEANLYETHRQTGCDTVSYSIVKGGRLTQGTMEHEIYGHAFTRNSEIMAMLDINCRQMVMGVEFEVPKLPDETTKPLDTTPLDDFLAGLVKQKKCRTVSVSFCKRNGGRAAIAYNLNAEDVTKGTRYDVTADADNVTAELRKLMQTYRQRGQVYSYVESALWGKEVCLILGEHEHCYLLDTSQKGTLKILHVARNQNKGLFVPEEWRNIVEYNNGVMR